ncbi:FAR1-related sequence 5-like protein [Tanacetum coccineum]
MIGDTVARQFSIRKKYAFPRKANSSCGSKRRELIEPHLHFLHSWYVSCDSDNQNDDDVDMELEKDEYNDVMAKIFDTIDDAYMFYNGYALLHGFGIRIHTTYKNKVTNEAYGRKFVCNKEGFKDLKGKGPDGGDKKRRRDLRTGCEAFLRININKDRKWFVKEFKNAHNHELTATPTKVMKHRSHGKFHRSMACKSLMSELSHSGLTLVTLKR